MLLCKDCQTLMLNVMSFSKEKHERFNRCPKCFSETKHTKINDNDLDFGEMFHNTVARRYGNGHK